MLRIVNNVRFHGRHTWPSQFSARWLTACPSQCRRYSTPPVLNQSDDVTNVKVKIGNTGHVFLMIRHAPRPETASPIIIYLKRGTPSAHGSSDADNICNLATSANATVVYVDYKNSKALPYPIPIHTVVRAYDWVQQNLAGSRPKTNDRTTISRVGVCGELVGGSLAAMLALTECHSASPGISAAALGNPIVDWTALHLPEASKEQEVTPHVKFTNRRFDCIALHPPEATPHFESTNKNRDLQEEIFMSMESLLTLREDYFSKAEKYHDPFASPLLFFRTPSSDLPLEHAPSQSSNSEPNPEEIVSDFFKKRRSLRKYPPTYSDLIIPNIRVNVGKESVLRDQGFELVDLMRKSFGRWEVDRFTHLGNDIPQRRFEALDWEGRGLWNDKEVLEIGNWFGDVLRKP